MITITVGQRKGGNGKSTSALNLAHGFARKGKRVLLIDMDEQRNATGAIETRQDSGYTIEEVLTKPEVGVEEASCATSWEGVRVIASSASLSGAVRELEREVGSHLVPKEKLAEAEGYDLCLIDTPPSLNILVVNALCASRYLFIPLSSRYFSLEGLGQTVAACEKVRARLNGSLEVLALAFVIHDGRSSLAREVVEKARSEYGDLVCRTVVGQNIKIEEAQVRRRSIFEYAEADRGSVQYASLTEELLSRMGGGHGQSLPRGL